MYLPCLAAAQNASAGPVAEGFALHESLEIHARAAPRVEDVLDDRVEVELIGDALGQREIAALCRRELRVAERLEIGDDHARAERTRALQAAREQRRLAHLPRALHEHDRVAPRDRVAELGVGLPHDVEARVERDGAADRLEGRERRVRARCVERERRGRDRRALRGRDARRDRDLRHVGAPHGEGLGELEAEVARALRPRSCVERSAA
jgi:hypothetical protein